jgi:hypothetical protein
MPVKTTHIVQFPAITKDGIILPEVCMVAVDCRKVKSKGETIKRVYDNSAWAYRRMTGYFIEYNGVEYGTISMCESELLNTCNGNICDEEMYQVHVSQFAIQFY